MRAQDRGYQDLAAAVDLPAREGQYKHRGVFDGEDVRENGTPRVYSGLHREPT